MENPLLKKGDNHPEEFPDFRLGKAREGPAIESDLPMLSSGKRTRSSGLINKGPDCLAVHRMRGLSGDSFLIAEHAPVRATLVRNKDRDD